MRRSPYSLAWDHPGVVMAEHRLNRCGTGVTASAAVPVATAMRRSRDAEYGFSVCKNGWCGDSVTS